MPRRCSFLASLLAALVLAAGCAKHDASAPSTGAASSATSASTPPGKKVLLYGNGAEPQDLDFQIVTGSPEHHLALTFFEGLISEDPQLNILPGVAERWEISPDGLVYTFHLRADAKWSDGDPLTADDFVQTYRRMITPALGAEYSYMLWHVVGAEDYNKSKLTDFAQTGFKAPDPRTVQLTLRHPTPFLLHAMNHYAWFPLHIPTLKKFGALDRRHIQERDVWRLREGIATRLNLEMACTPAMTAFALKLKPETVCVVPESRQEITTEGGLDVVGNRKAVRACIDAMTAAGIQTSLFIDPDEAQIELAAKLGAPIVELHTGAYANAYLGPKRAKEFQRLRLGCVRAHELGLTVNAGHGLNYVNIAEVRTLPHLHELNIGHSIISRALFTGIEEAVREMKRRANLET